MFRLYEDKLHNVEGLSQSATKILGSIAGNKPLSFCLLRFSYSSMFFPLNNTWLTDSIFHPSYYSLWIVGEVGDDLNSVGAPKSVINVSKNDYEQLPSYMKTLVSWEVRSSIYCLWLN